MKIEIVSIHEMGKRNEEYVKIKVLESCDLKYYIVADTTYTSDSSISNKMRHMYWFKTKDVSQGDYVFLYTGKGQDRSFANNVKTTTHVFYCGVDNAIWNDDGDGAILFAVSGWKAKKA